MLSIPFFSMLSKNQANYQDLYFSRVYYKMPKAQITATT